MEKGSIIDAQITLDEEQHKEIERCRDWKYYYITYCRIANVDGVLSKPNILPEYMPEILHKCSELISPTTYGVIIRENPRKRFFLPSYKEM